MAQALKDFASEIASHEMTAEARDRAWTTSRKARLSKENVVDESRDVLRRKVYEHLSESEEKFADIVWTVVYGRMRSWVPARTAARTSSSAATGRAASGSPGCSGYPDCTTTYPLPQRGDIIPLGTLCDACGAPEIKVLGGRRPWITCIDMDCPKKQEQREAKAEAKAAKEKEAKEKKEQGGQSSAGKEREGVGEVHHVASRLDLAQHPGEIRRGAAPPYLPA